MRTRQRGAILAVAVVLIVVIALMIATLGFLYVSNLRSSSLHSSSEQAYFAAFSGLERATRVLNSPKLSGAAPPDVNRVACANLTGDASVLSVTVAANLGQFTVTGGAAVSPSPAATLNGALTAVATTIPVNTVAGYSASGRIMIDRELIDYAGTSNVAATCGGVGLNPCFVGVRRGMAGTTAAAHANAVRVGQFQCDIQSTGFMPDSTNPRARRILSQGTQIHNGWAVGVPGGVAAQQPWTVRFRENAWNDFGNAILSANAQLNSISMLSHADGFAVGNPGAVAATRPLVIRWNGAAWSSINTGFGVNRALNSISCISANDCWAVGAPGGAAANQPWIVRWSGVWTNNAKGTLGATNVTLNAVSCGASLECWAVGNAIAGPREYFIRLTGGGLNWIQWNGAVNDPNIPDQNFLHIYCADTSNCWAVGAATSIVRWNSGAGAWVNETLAVGGAPQLNGIWCFSTGECWAVGNSTAVAPAGEVILHRTGGVWSRVAPVAGIPDVNLNEVMCIKTDDCWIVGNADATPTEVILHWDGAAWTRFGGAVGGPVSDRNLFSIWVIGADQRAPAARQEVYP